MQERVVSVYLKLRFELNLPVRMGSLILTCPNEIQLARKNAIMNGFITWRNIPPKFQLVHPGKLAENQLARSQNLLVTDERTSVEIFTALRY